jgi:hypothetical protein
MATRLVPIYQYYPLYNNTVHRVYMHGWSGTEGCPLFVTPVGANMPGTPPGATLEIGPVSRHVDGTIARQFTIRGYRPDNQSAPWGIAVVYAILEG